MPTTSHPDGAQVVAFKPGTAARTRFRFTRERIASIAKPLLNLPRPFVLRDTDVPGLCLRRQTGPAMVYWVEKRVRGRLWRVRLAQHTANVDLEAIRTHARDILHQLFTGEYQAALEARKAAEAAGTHRLALMTLGQAAEAYSASEGLRPDSVANYRIAVNRITGAVEGLSEKPIAQWTKHDVRAAFTVLCAEVKPHTASGYMAAARAVVEGWRNWHDDESIPPFNVVSLGMKVGNKSRWTKGPPRTRALHPTEVPHFISTLRSLANASQSERASMFHLVEFLALTGMRFAEAAELRWSEVSMPGHCLYIPADRMKGKRPFVKPLGSAALSLLETRRRFSGNGEFVFPSPQDPAIAIDDARSAVAEACKAARVTVTPHDLRRGYIRAAALAMLPTARIKTLVAHTLGKDVTEQYVGGLEVDPHADAQAVEDRLLGVPGGK